MKVTEAIEVLGSGAAVAKRAGTTRQNVWNWKAKGGRVPELYARRLHGARKGNRVLKFDPDAYLDS